MWFWTNEYHWRLIAMMQQEADKHTIRKPTIKKQKPPKQSFKAQMRSVNRNRWISCMVPSALCDWSFHIYLTSIRGFEKYMSTSQKFS